MSDEIKFELQRARHVFHQALRDHGRHETEQTRKALDVAGEYLAAAVSETLGL